MTQTLESSTHPGRRGRLTAGAVAVGGLVGACVYFRLHRDEFDALAAHSPVSCDPQT